MFCFQDDRIKYSPHLEAVVKQTTKKKGKDLCLDYFDIYYKKNFEKIWPSLRLALLSRPKFCALVNNYGDPEATFKRLKNMGCYSIKKQYIEAFENSKNNTTNLIVQRDKEKESILNSAESLSLENDISTEPLSMTPETALNRIILPQEMILQGGGSDLDAASASMYDFIPSTKIKGMEHFIEESEYYSSYNEFKVQNVPNTSIPVDIREHKLIDFPNHLEAFTFASGATDMRLEPPEKGILGTFDYYCMDAASLLPVIFLDVHRDNSVLDICSAPGGKTLAILQVNPDLKLC